MLQIDARERAQTFRLRAAELIWVAQGLRNSKGRAILLDTADEYHRMAETAEHLQFAVAKRQDLQTLQRP